MVRNTCLVAYDLLVRTVPGMLRRLAVTLAVASMLSSCSSGNTTDKTPSSTPESYTEVIDDLTSGQKVLVVGTSVMQQFGEALKEALEPSGIKVDNEARPMSYAFGEETPIGSLKRDFQGYVKASSPDLVLVQTTFSIPYFACTGSPEEQDVCRREGATATAAMYLPEMIDVLSSSGAKVVWVSFPATLYGLNPDNIETTLATDAANSVVLNRYKSEGDIVYSLATDVMGTDRDNIKLFTKVEGGYRQVRGPDGVHACQYGTQLVVERLASDIYPEWRSKVTSWPNGPWRQGKSYSMERYPWNKVVCTDEVVKEPIVYSAS